MDDREVVRAGWARRAVAVLAAAVLAGIALVACGDGTERGGVTPESGGSVALGPARVELPPRSVAGDATLVAAPGGPPATVGARTPQVAIASDPVTFDLTGSTATAPATVSFTVPADVVPASATGDDALWLARAAPGSDRWIPVGGRYDRAAGTVTAQGEPTGTWAVWTWDWRGIETRLRQQLAAFGTGRAAPATCPGVDGMRVEPDGEDPVLVGCVRPGRDGPTVEVTGNRGYSTVLRVPAGAEPGPPTYRGFEEYVRTRQRVVDALGGVYLAPTATLSFTVEPRGDPLEFRAAPSWKTRVLDLSVPAATAVFDVVTLGYAECVLDLVARSGPAPLSDAPAAVVQCFPGLAQANAAVRFYAEHLRAVSAYLRASLELLDQGRDRLGGETGVLRVVRPSLPLPSLYVSTGYERGALYPPDAMPSRIGIDNHNYVEELRWSPTTASGARATGVLNELVCVPSCADGLYRVYDVEVSASDPASCSVDVVADGSDAVRAVPAYAFTVVRIDKALPEPSPDPQLLGDGVITGACR